MNLPVHVGHIQGGSLPDHSTIEWRHKYNRRKKPVDRQNWEEFGKAAKEIFNVLNGCSPSPGNTWDSLQPRIERALASEDWKAEFPTYSDKLHYTRYDWRHSALEGNVEWDDFVEAEQFASLNLKWTGEDPRWFFFHKAAAQQRAAVHESLP